MPKPLIGAQRFTQLSDAPKSYAGQAGKAVVVKSDETGLEFVPFINVIGLEKITEVNVTSNTTSINFSGLDINTDKAYVIYAKLLHTTTTWKVIRCFINGDTNNSNYYYNLLYVAGSAAVESGNSAFFTGFDLSALVWYHITKLTNNASIARVFSSRYYIGINSYYLDMAQCRYLANHTNITSLTLVSSVTGGIGAGSKIVLYKYKVWG
jgi:hypothetical protein